MKYRKKPVVIEAVRFKGLKDLKQIETFAGDVIVANHYSGNELVAISIKTLEGIMSASKGDLIIKGVKGEFYPCKPDIFDQTYELVE
jgi:hypothetical protein